MNTKQIIALLLANTAITLLLIIVVVPMMVGQSIQEGTTSRSSIREESRIVELVEAVNPAVVSIVATADVPVVAPYDSFWGFFDLPFERAPREGFGTEERQVSSGSGFIVSEDGLVVTNRHVVSIEDAAYTAFTSTGEELPLEVIDRDPFLDIAILRVTEPGRYPALEFANSDELRLGQSVVAIGNALGEFQNSVSVGVVSGLARSIVAGSSIGQTELLENVIQTDAAINPGNSGGPLLNIQGEVIGVNVAVAQGSENIGFALPSNAVLQAVESVKVDGEIVRPYIGIHYVSLNEEAARQFDLEVTEGAYVTPGGITPAVLPNSPASKAGILEGDIIVKVDEVQITRENSLGSIIRTKSVGDVVELSIVRNGEMLAVPVTLERAPDNL